MPEKERICVYLRELPAQGKNGAGTHAGQKENSRRFLLETAAAYLKRLGRQEGTESWQIGEGERGKPFFAGHPAVCFSISHSGACWCCAFAAFPVGLDIQLRGFGRKDRMPEEQERLRLRTERIADRFFHPGERAWLREGGDFFSVWTAKESYVKYTGEGMGREFGSFAVADENGMLPFVRSDGPRAALLLLPAPPSYSLCLCAERIGETEIIKIGTEP